MRGLPLPCQIALATLAALAILAAAQARPQRPADAGRPSAVDRQPAPSGRHRLAGVYDADILRVIDGDTVEARVAIWFGQDVTTRIRLAGIDAPEVKGACGEERRLAMAARDRLAGLVEGRRVRIVAVSGDKYFGRVVAEIHVGDSGDIGRLLIAERLAAPYAGRRRESWCGWTPPG